MRSSVALIATVVLLAACGGSGDDRADLEAKRAFGHAALKLMSTPVPQGARIIEVDAYSFRFAPPEIDVRTGEDVGIRLTSHEGEHDISVKGVPGHVHALPGQTSTGGFRFDQPGVYTFYCTLPGHRAAGMEGTVTVTGRDNPE